MSDGMALTPERARALINELVGRLSAQGVQASIRISG